MTAINPPAARVTAYTAFFRANYPRLQRFCRSRWHGAAADDILAETMTIAWRRFEDVPIEGAFGWLCGVARKTALNHSRSQRRRERLVDVIGMETHRTARSVAGVADADLRGDLLDVLRRLPERDREIVLLAAWEGLTSAELGAYLGVSANAATVRLCRARARFVAEWHRLEKAA